MPTTATFLSDAEWQRRTHAALQWVLRSIAATGGQGSSHSYSPLLGWAKAYPETTGYLIETLLDYAEQDAIAPAGLPDLRKTASSCGAWLLTQQLPSGAFPAGLAGSRRESFFNSAMILSGLCRLTAESRLTTTPEPSAAVQPALRQLTDWLLNTQEKDGSWPHAAYVPGFVPAYYSYAVWRIVQASQVLQHPEFEPALRKALDFLTTHFLGKNTLQNWGFRPGAPAFSHTVAYTLEGFWECACYFQDTALQEEVLRIMQALLALRLENGRTPGRFSDLNNKGKFRGDCSFRCLSGNAQLSLLCSKIFRHTGEAAYAEAAGLFLGEILPFQYFGQNSNQYGALPGSWPVWGPYLRLRYPNWGVKFFLDAMLRVTGGLVDWKANA